MVVNQKSISSPRYSEIPGLRPRLTFDGEPKEVDLGLPPLRASVHCRLEVLKIWWQLRWLLTDLLFFFIISRA